MQQSTSIEELLLCQSHEVPVCMFSHLSRSTVTSFSFQSFHIRKLFPPYYYGAPGGMIEIDHLKCFPRKTHFHTQSFEETNIMRNIGSVSAHLKCSEIMRDRLRKDLPTRVDYLPLSLTSAAAASYFATLWHPVGMQSATCGTTHSILIENK